MVTCLTKCLIIVFISFSGLWGLDKRAEDLKQELLDNYSTIRTFEADFNQQNYWQELDKELNSKGKIYFNNDNLKLDYTKPEGQFLILDSLQVTMYDPSSNQAIISSSSEIDIRPRSIILKYWQDSLLVSCNLKPSHTDSDKLALEEARAQFLNWTNQNHNHVITLLSVKHHLPPETLEQLIEELHPPTFSEMLLTSLSFTNASQVQAYQSTLTRSNFLHRLEALSRRYQIPADKIASAIIDYDMWKTKHQPDPLDYIQ